MSMYPSFKDQACRFVLVVCIISCIISVSVFVSMLHSLEPTEDLSIIKLIELSLVMTIPAAHQSPMHLGAACYATEAALTSPLSISINMNQVCLP